MISTMQVLKFEHLFDEKVEKTYFCKKCGVYGEHVTRYKKGTKILDHQFDRHCPCRDEEVRRKQDLKDFEELRKKCRSHILVDCGLSQYQLKQLNQKTEVNEDNKEACRYITSYMNQFHRFETTKSILMLGPSGTGKTFLAAKVLAGLATKHDINVHFVAANELYNKCLSRYHEGASVEDYMCYLENVHFLVLDDLGTEKTNDDFKEKLFRIFQRRMNTLPTVITTNLNEKEISARYGERIVSRIYGSYKVLAVKGQDFRKKSSAKKKELYDNENIIL